ncbi:hypothetical protein L484_008509 [Morus notabilis]|uniref:Uncharacterized protein n=1 Tax=Morus notabilis TaxID=981085 RepID=W9RZZ6_9ROSA|nr:hypothetical protein L484_008509 [Morus notabilis]
MDKPHKKDNLHVVSLLQSLKRASKDLQINPISSILNQNDTKSAIEALLELETKADAILTSVVSSSDPILLNLSELLTDLKSLSEKLQKSQGRDLRSLFRRQIFKYKIFQIACSIEAGIQSYIDREIVVNLVTTLIESRDEDERLKVLIVFGNRLSQGFDTDFQELVLRGRVFTVLEFVLCGGSSFSKRVRNQACLIILGLVKFNKDVFVGLVLMGPTIQSLISISSFCSTQVLCSMIRFIGTPLVDEIEANGEIPRIVKLLSSEEDAQVQVAAMHCVLEMAVIARREVVEKMLRENLVKKMMVLQRSKMFGNCVARFAEQVEVGEGMEKREKRVLRAETLRRVREASVSDTEAAAVVAEVLWGSSY